jgi:hypothetical protein
MSKPLMYQLEYLRCEGEVFFLGLKGPRGGVRCFPFSSAEMIRLMDAYLCARGVPGWQEGEALWQRQAEMPVGGGDRGDVVSLSDAAASRDSRRRVALVERLAELEVLADAVARGALQLTAQAFPAAVEALELVLASSKSAVADGAVLERLVRADPERARHVLDGLTDPEMGAVTETAGDDSPSSAVP